MSAFTHLARRERPGLARLLLSAAGEFREVDNGGARVELDRMAARLYLWTERQGLTAADAIGRLLVEHDLRPSSLSRLYCLTGDVQRALHAAELRAELPIGRGLRARLAFEAGALQAMFN